jgi:cyclin-dependent kinase-like
MREIKLLKQLALTAAGPYVVSLKEVFRRNRKMYLVFEYCEKTVLEELEAAPEGLPRSRVAQITRQVCEGLREMHAYGTMHRDIKPENLLVDAAGNVKICDFGFARSIGAPGTLHVFVRAERYGKLHILHAEVASAATSYQWCTIG